ncbi:hypothetical protein [Botrimarina hoheduenensis]|uniref:Uncharacterized protein n=1 Tax=Botrimarina hoheduenensis TaxID=2528000 RepID=A0A5C5VW63_9BACT|nr:hypothetical protein [Botrimarina hoheduenensis]TWT42858.1 hypothetical protein Pla111_24960 [Botrimarina hoheduenensis]
MSPRSCWCSVSVSRPYRADSGVRPDSLDQHHKCEWEKVDSFPKSQRFVFGTRLADHAIGVLDILVEASYSTTKAALLADANRKVETLRKPEVQAAQTESAGV